jgi:hypothetical protein
MGSHLQSGDFTKSESLASADSQSLEGRMNPNDYLCLHLINSDGRTHKIYNVHYTLVGREILQWIGQQAAGEVLVKPVCDFGNIAQMDE